MIATDNRVGLLLGLHLFSMRCYGFDIVRLDRQSMSLRPSKSTLSSKVNVVVLTFVMGIIWGQIYASPYSAATLENMVYAVSGTGFIFCSWEYIKKNEDICLLWNQFVNLESKIMNRASIVNAQHSRILNLVYLIQMSACNSAPSSIGTHCLYLWFRPCSMFLPGYFLLPECSNHFKHFGFNETAVRTAICLTLLYALFATTACYILACLQLMIIQVLCLRFHLKEFHVWIQLQISRNQQALQASKIQKYQQLQILVTSFNNVHKFVTTPIIVLLTLIDVVLSLYTLMEYINELSFVKIVILVYVILVGFFLAVLSVGTMGNLYSDSEKVLKSIRHKLTTRLGNTNDFKYLKRYLCNLRPFKVRVWDIRVVDQFARIEIVDCVANQLASLLLLN